MLLETLGRGIRLEGEKLDELSKKVTAGVHGNGTGHVTSHASPLAATSTSFVSEEALAKHLQDMRQGITREVAAMQATVTQQVQQQQQQIPAGSTEQLAVMDKRVKSLFITLDKMDQSVLLVSTGNGGVGEGLSACPCVCLDVRGECIYRMHMDIHTYIPMFTSTSCTFPFTGPEPCRILRVFAEPENGREHDPFDGRYRGRKGQTDERKSPTRVRTCESFRRGYTHTYV